MKQAIDIKSKKWKKLRRKIRSKRYPDMRPHIFDKVVSYLPHVLAGIELPDNCIVTRISR